MIDPLSDIKNVVKMVIISGAICRIVYCIIRMILSDEEAPMCRRRIKHALIIVVLTLSITSFQNMLSAYFIHS